MATDVQSATAAKAPLNLIPRNMVDIMQELRREMVEMLKIQGIFSIISKTTVLQNPILLFT